jgi:agmatine/peptidylarginine deiminase
MPFMPETHRFSVVMLAGVALAHFALACLLLGSSSGLAQVRQVPAEVLASIADDEATLPRGFTPAERAQWQPPELSRAPLAPPPRAVWTPAEYDKNGGLLIRWGSQNAVLTEMVVAITTGEPEIEVFIVVSGSTQQSSASSTLSGAGADLSRVSFVQAASNSVWMRDYGPRFIDHAGLRAIVDHAYNRPRPLDNAIPGVFAQLLGERDYDIPLIHGGGNFHLFDDGSAYMTSLIVDENPGLSAQQIRDYYLAYQGLDLTITDPLPASFDSTQHIDMWMLPADDGRVIVNEYPDTGGVYTVPRQVSEATAAQLASRGKQVLRIGGWRVNGTHYTYANAVVLNRLVLICRFNGYPDENANAIDVFEQAFPSRQIVTIDCSELITFAGAIHCIVMHAPAVLLREGFELLD